MKPTTKITAAVIAVVLGIAAAAYADIWVDPTSFDVNTPEGCVVNETLTVGNDGAGALNFMIRTRQVGSSGENTILSSEPAHRDFTMISPNASYHPGRLIVRFAQSGGGRMAAAESRSQILSALGGASIEREFEIVPGLCVVDLPAGVTVEEALQTFNNTDGILYAEPDYRVTIDSTIPNDTRFGELWGMHNTGQSGGTVDADIDAPEAWDISTGSSDIIVAVIDTGVDYTHPDLAGNMWVNTGEIPGNGLDDDGNGYVDDVYGYDFCNYDGDPMDDHYHGTHCAGTIGGIGNNNQGVAGVCWDVRIMALKFLDSGGGGWTSDAINCVNYSRLMGAKLSSNSWGGGGYDQGLKDAIDAAGAAGMLFVAAAGNNGGNNDTYPHYPSSYDSESLIAVMATDRYDNKSSFSNYGPVSVDLGAPGSDILSCQPGNRYQYLNGTSMATPHVAGACALLWSMNAAAGNLEIKNILIETVDPTLSGQCVSGGRLNLYNAILETRAPWIIIEPEEGMVGPGDSVDVNVTFDALELTAGVYEAEIVVLSDAPSSPTIIPVTLTVTPDDLQVAPVEDFESSGTRGGPFTPKCMTYTLTNNGIDPVNWTTSETESWFSVEPNAGVLGPSDSIEVDVCITSDANLLVPDTYEQVLALENTNSGSIKQRLVTLTVKPPDCFTELFGENGSDLKGLMLTFSPNGSIAYYEACAKKANGFPTDPNGGTYVSLGDDAFARVVLNDDASILFYGTRYDRFYIGSNGYITFGNGDTEFSASLENHFDMPRISALFADLTPSDNNSISYKQLQDRVAVTFKDVPLYGNKTAKNSFQVEMFYADGTIRITWLKLAPAICIAGLSEGYGLPPMFLESDLSEYAPCWPNGDFNRDYYVNMLDLGIFVSHWLEEDCGVPYWCEKTDLDFSGITEFADYAIFAENWLTVEDWWLQPISHWKFDEGSGSIAYDSAGNNDGTVYGATWTAGQIDGALSFDGSNDYVGLSSFAVSTEGGTISLWFKTSANFSANYGGMGYLISKDSQYFGYLTVGGDGTAPYWIIGETDSQDDYFVSIEGAAPVGAWNHVAVSFDNKQAKTYLNGELIQTMTVTSSSLTLTRIGGRTQEYFNGKIDDIRIYDRALSAEEIEQLYRDGLGPKAFKPHPADGATNVDPNVVLSWSPGENALSHDVFLGTNYDDVNDADANSPEYKGTYDVNTFDPCGLDLGTTYYWRIDERSTSSTTKGDVWSFTTSLISWWKFDEGSGTIAYDSVGDYDGTITGAAWTTEGKINSALSFDADGDYVYIPGLIPGNKGTFATWVKSDVDISNTAPRRYNSLLYSNRSQIFLGSSVSGYEGNLRFIISPSSGQYSILHSNKNFWSANEWYHIVCTWNGTTQAVYVNGILDKSQSQTYSGGWGTTYIGGVSGTPSYSFDGVIDEVHLYDRVLSAEEIWQLYREGLGPKASYPNPANGATSVELNTILSWSPGKDAATHDVYLGVDFDDVNDADTNSPEYKGNFGVNSFDPCGLELSTNYYWRIDEVNESNLWKGDVWSFTTRAAFDPNLGLINWWKFDEGSGTIAYDSAGSNNGTVYGATWTTGQIGGALSYDGVNDYVGLSSFTVNTNNGAISLWFQTSADFSGNYGGMGYLISKDSQYFGYLTVGGDGTVPYWIIGETDSQDDYYVSAEGAAPVGTWNHLVVSFYNKQAKTYINDELIETRSVTNSSLTLTRIGGRTSEYFNGKIDDVRIYDRALSAAEVEQLYQAGL